MRLKNRAIALLSLLVLATPSLVGAETWTTPVLIDELNSSCRDVDMTITPDGKTAYFASDRSTCEYGGFDIYASNLVGATWSGSRARASTSLMISDMVFFSLS